MSHRKHDRSKKGYEYKVISSQDLKKRDRASIDAYLNALSDEGWKHVTIDLKETGNKVLSFVGLMKRKVYRNTKARK